MKRLAILALLALAAALPGCAPEAKAPVAAPVALPSAFVSAFRTDATGSADDAVRAYLEVVRAAAAADGDPWQVPALQASLDALTEHSLPALGAAARDAALVRRTRDGDAVTHALNRAAADARGPFARGLVARALLAMAQRRGDAAEAERQRQASGCAREALVVGPTSWAPITGVVERGPLDGPGARVEASYATDDPFTPATRTTLVRGRGCAIELSADRARPGVRDVVIDVPVGRAQTIGLVLRAHGAASLHAGGNAILARPFELGDGEAARFARVSASAGQLRVVARVGTAKDVDSVEIDAFGEDGAPLPVHAPAIGSTAAGAVLGVQPEGHPAPTGNADDAVLAAAAALASGDPRGAERILWPLASRIDARPDVALVYGRAIDATRDLSAATRAERSRGAYERVLAGWPTSWEAAIAHAVLAGVRRGRDEAGPESLRDLEELRARSHTSTSPLLDAYEALTASRERLFDRAQAALGRANLALAGTALLVDAEDAGTPRVGADLATVTCDLARPSPHDTFACLDALRDAGDRAGATREIERLRSLFGAPERLLPLEAREALIAGDTATAQRAFEAMLPAERTLSTFALLGDPAASPADARARLLALATTARDAPGAIAPLLRATGDDAAAGFDTIAEQVAAEDHAHPIMPNAGTAVLSHVERYVVGADGLTHWTLLDVRRVNGTTDVDENAQAGAAELLGRTTARAIRRRILKRDGRVLEPDRTPHASQAHADLSQLEQGDIVEAVYEGWALPSDTGDIGIDTPDLLPERTAVHDATIELRLPPTVHGSLWSHPLLGKPAELVEGGARVLTWHVKDLGPRRIEDGVPKMDRNVAVSFSTAQWSKVARALRETLAALDEHDPEIGAWARDVVAGAGAGAPASPRATVEAIVAAAGKALREADPGTLSDYGAGIAAVQTQTARTFLASHDGSRAWLVLRSLRELGIPAELVVSESDPYSADPAFPPHFGRFVHPLVVAHLPPSGPSPERADLWIDADVAGPPLPAGRVSPELRGRLALRTDGSIAPLPAVGTPGGERDEVDVRLALDAQGNARGTFAIVLRGREAQELAEALFRVVGAQRQRALREVVLAWLPWANVDEVQLASSDGSWQVSLRAEVSVSGYAQAEGKTWLLPGIDPLHWAWPRARVSNLAATFATRAGRESALAVSAAVQYHVHRRVELPAGAVVARLPGPLDIKAGLVEASRKMTVEKSAIEDDFLLGVATGTVPPGEYETFVGAAHRADDGFLASTRLSVP
jgi:hypothetical protein